jgi:glycosyltransferase involved in cell wall biosynthesis
MGVCDRARVLIVTNAYPSVDEPLDGVFVRDQAVALARCADVGVALVDTVSPREWPRVRGRCGVETVAQQDGLPVYRMMGFVATTRSERLYRRARARALRRAVDRFVAEFGGVDVIHAHCAAFAGEVAVDLGQELGVPVVVTEHYSFLPELIGTYGRRLLEVYENADAVLGVSRSLATRMRGLGVRRPIAVCPDTYDPVHIRPAPIEPPVDGRWKLVCVARDDDTKNVPMLIDAVAMVAGEIDVEVHLVGAGAFRRARAMSGGLGLGGRITFAGPLPRGAVAERIRACHLLVSSSRIETFGVTLVEALATGRPVVATDSGGPRDIVRSADGRLTRNGDPVALADAIADVIRTYATFDQDALAASARDRFGPEALAARLLDVYASLRAVRGSAVGVTCPARPKSRLLETSVIVPTRNRADHLGDCLDRLAAQTTPPDEIIIADASDDDTTRERVAATPMVPGTRLRYLRCRRRGASAQRNEAIDAADGRILFFLDDDICCEPRFIEAIVEVLRGDAEHAIAGVSGTIVNQTFAPPSRVGRAFMRWMAGKPCDDYSGRLIGPAWNQLPADAGDAVREVDWLPGGCTAYRAAVFDNHRFNEAFGEYPYAEDVHLSASVARVGALCNTGRARAFHKDLGFRSHRCPVALGRAQVLNRWAVMRDVLGRTGVVDRFKLAALQLYFGVGELRACFRAGGWRRAFALWCGRLRGLVDVFAAMPPRTAGRPTDRRVNVRADRPPAPSRMDDQALERRVVAEFAAA